MNRIVTGIILLAILGAAAFYVLKDRNYTIKITETQLRERIDDQLPFSEDYLLVFNVTFDNPRVDLLEGAERIAGGLDALVKVKVGSREIPVSSAVDVSGGVRYDATLGAFFLIDPVVENVQMQGLPDRFANGANAALSLALREFYEERPIYTLADDDFKQSTAKFILRDVVVKNEKLHVTLGLERDSNQ